MTSPNPTDGASPGTWSAAARTIPAELYQYARSQIGGFAERYRLILRRAFSSHTMLLNARQLRELAGGGSQTTAQRAIDEFREELAAQFAHRIRLGADVPASLVSGATELLENLWGLARDEAGQQFQEDRSTLQAQAEQAQARAVQLQADRDQLSLELVARNAELATVREALTQRAQELVEVRAALDTEVQARQQEQARHQAQCAQLEQASQRVREELQQELVHMTLLRDNVQRAMETERRDAGHRFDRLLLEHREALGTVKRQAEEQMGAARAQARAEVQALHEKLQAAAEHTARLEALGASSTQEIQRLQATERSLQARLDALQAQAQQAQAQALASQQRLIEALERGASKPAS